MNHDILRMILTKAFFMVRIARYPSIPSGPASDSEEDGSGNTK